MASQTSNNTNGTYAGTTIADLPKSWTFTSSLPPDPLYPTPSSSDKTPRENITPRIVKGALYTYVRPSGAQDPELLATSPRAMRDLGIQAGSETSSEFLQTVSGNLLHGYDTETETETGGYPWAQCYGGWQFGSWAGQLGDGRAISLFETINPSTEKRYELQLKGAGITPYSRFADGKAVLRSSIREFIVSEALNALGIPSTRALSLTLLPHERIRREAVEPGAIVARFAESWLRIGTFDLLRARGDGVLIRQLSTYIAGNVFGGWTSLPSRIPDLSSPSSEALPTNVPETTIEGPPGVEENRFARLYRHIVRLNALTVAKWQAYGFMNGVLNTDNTSIMGLSIDFGPFAFMDNFDPMYTPNHDDHMLRYSYRNQPTIIWWNLVRLGEGMGELIGIGPKVDNQEFIEKGLKEGEADEVIKRAEQVIERTGEEYNSTFLGEYKRVMMRRLGLRTQKEEDFKELLSEGLDMMEALELDFNQFFRKLSGVSLSSISTPEQRLEKASIFFHHEGPPDSSSTARERVAAWLETWRSRIIEDRDNILEDPEKDTQRQKEMKAVNPRFIPKSWVLEEIIRRVEKDGERDVLKRIMRMVLNPFEDGGWGGEGGDREEEERWCGDVPRRGRALQCSCSS